MTIENMEERIREALDELYEGDIAKVAELDNLGGHASLRIYWRVHLPEHAATPRGEYTQMAMVLPQSDEAMKSEEGMSSEAAQPDELPFVNVQRYLDSIGVPVPDIDLVDMELGVLLLEDLGDETFEDGVEHLRARRDLAPEDRQEAFLDLYREAIDVLVAFQEAVLRSVADPQLGTNDGCIGFERSFDRELLRWELDHYREWGLEARLGADAVADRREALDELFERIVDELLEFQPTLVLRDFQSRNLMRKGGSWTIIDFQDALKGPFVYDLVALLRDSYIELRFEQVETLLDHYVERAAEHGLPWVRDPDQVWRAFHLQTVQRKLKDAGRFVYIDREKGDSSFLQYYDSSIGYVRQAIERLPGFDELAAILTEIEPSWNIE